MALSKALQVGFVLGLAFLEADSDRLVKATEFKDWLVGFCGIPKDTKVSKEAWSECRKTLCPVTGSVNDVLKASAGKHISDCDENTKRARMDQSIRSMRSQLLNGRDGKAGVRGTKKRAGKATVTKVVGVAKAQIKVIATKPKKLSDTLKVILATLQATPELYKAQKQLEAALQTAIDLAV